MRKTITGFGELAELASRWTTAAHPCVTVQQRRCYATPVSCLLMRYLL